MKIQKNCDAFPLVSHQQSGYIMLLVAVFLLVLMAGSAQLFGRIAKDTITSGSLRDSTESLMLADTAMESLRGQFINTLDTAVEAPTDAVDNIVAGQLPANIANPDAVLFPYMYYVTAGAGLDQTQPSILQKIANGEAVGTAAAALAARSIPSATNQLRMNDLFAAPGGTAIAPLLFTVNAGTGLLTASAAANWNAEPSAVKAAVWIEVFQNLGDASSVDIFVQAMSQVGNAKSYVQRYVGTYNSTTTLGTISALAEARNFSAP